MGVFDALVILAPPGVAFAEIARTGGPIEPGEFWQVARATQWMPAAGPERVAVGGFGIDAGGSPYFDSHAVDEGDEADLWLDASVLRLWLQAIA